MELTSPKSKKGLVGKIQHRENLGSDVYLHLTLKDSQQKIIIRSDPVRALDVKIGDEVKAGWIEDKVLAFDSDGQSLPIKTQSKMA